jgi:ribosomal protein L40E
MIISSVANSPMWSGGCPLCEHVNPPGAKFCNACGTAIDLVPCPSCGAVNDPTATSCHQCAAALPENVPAELARPSAAPAANAAESRARPAGGGPEPDAPLSLSAAGLDRDGKLIATLQELRRVLADADPAPAAVTRFPAIRVGSRIAPRRRLAVIVGAAVLAILAVVGYYANREPPTANLQSSGRVATGAAGAAISLPASEGAKGPGVSTSSPTPPPAVAADPQPAKGTAAGARPDAQARAPSEPAAPVSSAVTTPSSTDVERGILKHHPPRVGACTEGAAALGLCAPQDNQRRN